MSGSRGPFRVILRRLCLRPRSAASPQNPNPSRTFACQLSRAAEYQLHLAWAALVLSRVQSVAKHVDSTSRSPDGALATSGDHDPQETPDFAKSSIRATTARAEFRARRIALDRGVRSKLMSRAPDGALMIV